MIDKLTGWLESKRLLSPLGTAPTIVDLARCVAASAGAQVPAFAERLAPLCDELRGARGVVFVLADGLGMNLRHLYPAGGFLDRHLRCELRSVFPSTTATALTSLYSLQWPARSGVTGWHTHLPESGRTATVLPFKDRVSGVHLSQLGYRAKDVFMCGSAFPGFRSTVVSLLPRHITTGVFADWIRAGGRMDPYDDLADGFARAADLAVHGPGRTAVYLYVPDVDSAEHDHGVECEQVASLIIVLDDLLVELRRRLPEDVCIVLTADHGLVTIPKAQQLYFPHDHPLMKYLSAYPSAEATTPVFHVLPGREEEFPQAFAECYGEAFVLVRPEEAHELGLFGPEPLRPVMRRRLGTFLGIACDPIALISVLPDTVPVNHLGFHGGLRPEEMRVPLIVG